MGVPDTYARAIADQIVDTFGGATFRQPIFGVEMHELPSDIRADIVALAVSW